MSGDLFGFALLALAAYRTTLLVVGDAFPFGPLRERIWRRWPYPGAGVTQEMMPDSDEYRRHVKGTWLGSLMMCPACFGIWASGAWWLAWRLWPGVTLAAAVPFAIAGVGRFMFARS